MILGKHNKDFPDKISREIYIPIYRLMKLTPQKMDFDLSRRVLINVIFVYSNILRITVKKLNRK